MKNQKSYNKYIFILFISIFLSVCFIPIIQYKKNIQILTLYISLIIIFFIISILIDFTLNFIFKKLGKTSYLIIEEKQLIKNERETGLDILRVFAIIFVPLIHFFGLSGYYVTPLDNKYIFILTTIRWISISAVPLFLIITGYFKVNKTIEKNHYKSILPVLFTHIFIASIRVYVDYKYHNINVDLQYIINKIVYFEYGWYVKLYIGMILFMPFFNLAYNSLKTRRNKEILILTFILLTSLGPLTFEIIPKTWNILYVFMYYFIGAYFKEYKVKLNPIIFLIFSIFTVFITTVSSFYNSNDQLFNWDNLGYSLNSGYSSFPVILICIFLLILCTNINIKFKPIQFLFKIVSLVSLEIYLFSQMFDIIIYTPLQNAGYTFYDFVNKAYLILPTILCLSFLCAYIKKAIFFTIKFIFSLPIKLINKFNNKTE